MIHSVEFSESRVGAGPDDTSCTPTCSGGFVNILLTSRVHETTLNESDNQMSLFTF